VLDFLMWLEHNGFSTWVHESTSLFSFPGILLLHTIGMALVVGIAAAIDLRILGFAPAMPIAPMERFLPVLWVGFWINTVTGGVLFAVSATKRATQLDFLIKMLFIALAVMTVRMIKKRVFRDPGIDAGPLSIQVKVLAGASLVFWVGAIVAGRLLAYVGQIG
jgi:hypothetical protein